MKTASRTPDIRLVLSSPTGDSQLSSGVTAPSGAEPVASRTRATTTKINKIATWASTSTRCTLADSSVPLTQSQVITKMITTAKITTAGRDSDSAVNPNSSNVYSAATSASEPITSTPVVKTAQPPIQPRVGPMARVTQENVVPQSWSARFM